MIGSVWGGGARYQTGYAVYGIKISVSNRDHYFPEEWNSVFLTLEGETGEVEVNINKPSFKYGGCTELTDEKIKQWLKKNGKDTWPKGHPHKIKLEPDGEQHLTATFV